MDKVQIEWGNVHRTDALEADIEEKASKVLEYCPNATNFLVHLKVTNPKSSAGKSMQNVTMELRIPQHQDIFSKKEGDDLYKSIKEAQKAILIQLESKQNRN